MSITFEDLIYTIHSFTHGAHIPQSAYAGITMSSSPTAKPDPGVKKTSTTSLDILNPQPWVPRTSKSDSSETEQMLEQLSKGLVEVFCANDWASPLLAYVNPQFQAYIDYSSAQVRSLQEHIDFHKSMHEQYPGYVYEVQAVSADVDEVKGLASTWTTLRVTGHPQKIQRESITVFWWRRKQGMWRVYKQFGVRGVGWFAEGYQEDMDSAQAGGASQEADSHTVRTVADHRIDSLDVQNWLPDVYDLPE